MEDIKTGGPAFPNVSMYQEEDGAFSSEVDNPGMTLRDYFAAKALSSPICDALSKDKEWDNEHRAAWAYRQADAMLAAREGGAK